ncbi:MAG: hypothetical protein J4N85_11230, partial [Chloroflexi bacterium]|nr:hypothetical protein [Chloroflexota bacterium]
ITLPRRSITWRLSWRLTEVYNKSASTLETPVNRAGRRLSQTITNTGRHCQRVVTGGIRSP